MIHNDNAQKYSFILTHFLQRLFLEGLLPEGNALTLVAAPGRDNVLVAAAGVAAAHLTIPHPVPGHDNMSLDNDDHIRP